MTAVYALCPYCGSTIQVRKDDRIRHHRGPDPAYPKATACKRGMRTATTGWPEHTDSRGRTVRTHPGEFAPGRLVGPQEMWDLIHSPEFTAAWTPDQKAMLDRFEIRVKGAEE